MGKGREVEGQRNRPKMREIGGPSARRKERKIESNNGGGRVRVKMRKGLSPGEGDFSSYEGGERVKK